MKTYPHTIKVKKLSKNLRRIFARNNKYPTMNTKLNIRTKTCIVNLLERQTISYAYQYEFEGAMNSSFYCLLNYTRFMP